MKTQLEILERIALKNTEIRNILLKNFEEGATKEQKHKARCMVNGCDGYIAALEWVLGESENR